MSFANGDVGLDLSLAHEDVLSPGRYEATVAAWGPGLAVAAHRRSSH